MINPKRIKNRCPHRSVGIGQNNSRLRNSSTRTHPNQRRANEQIKNLLTGQWSPDGKRVFFRKDGETYKNVYLANADGSDERQLPLDTLPSGWSPDGTKLVYARISDNDKTDAEIYVYDIETRKRVNLTNHPAFDADPLFSPDGAQITFVSSRDGNKEST